MKQETASPRVPILSSFLKLLGIFLAAIALLTIVLYSASPWLIERIAPKVAERVGVEIIEVQVGYPGLHSVRLDSLKLVSDALTIEGQNGRLGYSLRNLFQGQLNELAIESVDMSVSASTSTADQAESITIDQAFNIIPFRRVDIERIVLRVPNIGFVGAGSASKSETALSFSMDGIEPEQASHFGVSADVSVDEFELRFAERDGDASTEFLSARGAIAASELTVDGNFNLSGYALTLGSALLGLPAGQGTVTGMFQTRVPWPPPDTLSLGDSATTFPEIAVEWQSDDGDLELSSVAGSLSIEPNKIDAVLSGAIQTRTNKSDITLTLPENYELHYDAGSLTGGSGLRVRIQQPTTDIKATLRSFSIVESQHIRLEFDTDVDATSETIHAVGNLNSKLTITRAEPMLAQGPLHFTGNVEAFEQIHQASLQSAINIDDDDFRMDGTVTSGIFNEAIVKLNYELESGEGDLTASNSVTFGAPLFATLVPDWDEAYDIDAGRMEVSLNLEWQSTDKIAAIVDINLAKCRAHYDDYFASGLSGELNLRSADTSNVLNWSLDPTALFVETVDVGFPITDLHVNLSWFNDQVDVSAARMSMLGGKAATTPFMYELEAGKTAFDLSLQELDLAQILALEGDDIVGTGTVDGNLPIVINNDKARVEGGTLKAQPPGGVIRLTPAFSEVTGQPGLDFAILALKNFNYTDLSSEIDYAENGDMTLAVHLMGRNPAVEQGRAIQYNLNISENIPVLLESLRLKDRVTEKVELGTQE
ncbi:MAG: YdbH domain-containing protein [Gammaproteobacteria bacterium]|nr:YdbH domain-containing protein [Gammaproteobacteria bacterium]